MNAEHNGEGRTSAPPRVHHESQLDALLEWAASLPNVRLAHELRIMHHYGIEQQWAIRSTAADRLEKAA